MASQTTFDYFPWALVSISAAYTCLAVLLPGKRQRSTYSIARIRDDNNFTLNDSLAVTYSVFSLLAAVLIIQFKECIYHPLSSRQFIDIELTSLADFQDHKDLLPSTEPKPSLRRRRSQETLNQPLAPLSNRNEQLGRTARVPAQIPPTARPISPKPTQPANPPAVVARREPSENHAKRTPVIEPLFVVSEQPRQKPLKGWQTQTDFSLPAKATLAMARTPSQQSPSTQSMEMEEVAPAKLLEVTDNDGDAGNDLWQAGGRSNGGKGARFILANYLRELHRRLKHAWSPPAETTSGKTEILFRLRKDGTLCSIKLETASKDAGIDKSAINAISSCAPFPHLPGEYSQEFLDLRYTFNYTADELKPVEDLTINATE